MDQVGRYQIEREIGRGAMGVVYLGYDPLLKRRVAVKTVLPGAASADPTWGTLLTRLTREAQAAASLNHPNIMGVYDIVPSGEMFSMVMEFIDGKTLAEAAPPGSRPDAGFVVRVLKECAAALDHAHSRGIVHRDIKPSNIMLDSAGVAKITDFGIAKLMGSATGVTGGFAVGTLEFMSPEQLKTSPVDGRSDQFSLAALAYRLLTDSPIFDADTMGAWCGMLLMQRPVAASSRNRALPLAVDAVLDRAMANHPAGRYESCGKFARELEQALIGPSGGTMLLPPAGPHAMEHPSPASPPHPPHVSPGHAARRRFWIVAGTVVAVFAIVILVWMVRSKRPEDPGSHTAPAGPQRAAQPHLPGKVPLEPGKSEVKPSPTPSKLEPTPPGAARTPAVAAAPEPVAPPIAAVPAPPVAAPPVEPGKSARNVEPGFPRQGAAGSSRSPALNPKDGQNYVWIPPGTFTMGCSGDGECDDDEKPAHEVTLTKGFWIGQTEATQQAYQQVMGQNPSRFKGAKLPVENITWDQAQAFCNAAGLRLPTEAEWEYAARAGSRANRYGTPDQIAWYKGNSGAETHEAGMKLPNAWGLRDMLGNVQEWVADWFAPYSVGGLTNPAGPATGRARGQRGGAMNTVQGRVRLPARFRQPPASLLNLAGVRCVGN